MTRIFIRIFCFFSILICTYLLMLSRFSFAGKINSTVKSKNTTGTLKLKVGVVFKSGDVKFIAKRYFYLLSKSLASISEQNYHPLSLIGYLQKKGASAELINFIKKKYPNAKIFIAPFYDDVKDEKNIPEFVHYIKNTKNDIETCENEQIQLAESGITPGICSKIYISVTNEKFLPIYFRYGTKETYTEYLLLEKQFSNIRAKSLALSYVVGSCQTSFSGDCLISAIQPGEYWITPIEKINIAGNNIMWDFPIKIHAGIQDIELSNDNMAEFDKYDTSLENEN